MSIKRVSKKLGEFSKQKFEMFSPKTPAHEIFITVGALYPTPPGDPTQSHPTYSTTVLHPSETVLFYKK